MNPVRNKKPEISTNAPTAGRISNGMKVLMFSSDPWVDEAGSAVFLRMREYAKVLDKLEIIKIDAKDGKLFRFWKGYKKARAVLLREKFDLITAQEIEHSFLAWKLSKKFSVPWQMQIHADIFSPYYFRGSFFNKIRIWLASFLIPRADGIRVVSERIKNSILKTINYKLPTIRVLPIYSDASKPKGWLDIKKKYPGYELYVLMASRLTHEKNISLALDAFREIVNKGPEILLVIVGDGLLRTRLEDEAKYGLEGNVYFEGWKSAEDLADYYQSADCLLITSNYEGYSLAALEALGSRLPVLMTDVGLAHEVVKDGQNGIIFPVGDRSALVGSLTKIKNDKTFLKKLSEGAKNTPRPYVSFDDYRNKLVESWKACLKR